jgi:hypothetical protein
MFRRHFFPFVDSAREVLGGCRSMGLTLILAGVYGDISPLGCVFQRPLRKKHDADRGPRGSRGKRLLIATARAAQAEKACARAAQAAEEHRDIVVGAAR